MPGAQEKDLNPNTYIGLSFPLRKDNRNDFTMTKTSLEQAKHNLRNLLMTYPGERVGQPEFGSTMRELCFEPVDDNLPASIEEVVRKDVETWLPYINILEVNTLTGDQDQSKIYVEVKYSTILNPQTQQEVTLDAGYSAQRV